MTVNGVDEEEAVLGAILTDGSCYSEVAAIIEEENYFYREEHRLIWRAMTELANSGQTIDPVAVQATLKKRRCLGRAGGASKLSSMMDILFDVGNVSEYAKLVKSASCGRDLKAVGKRLMNDNVDPDTRLDVATSELVAINKKLAHGKTFTVGSVSQDVLHDIIEGNGFNDSIEMGFYGLDIPLNGLQPKHYIVLGARPSVGKSALALQIAVNVARKGKRVLFVSPEMTSQQLIYRLYSLESGVPYSAITRKQKLKGEDKDAILEAREKIGMLDITLDDRSDQNVSQIRIKARQLHGESSGLHLLIVDYLQLLCSGDDDKASVTTISKGLKAIAKDLCIPVLACAQIRRRYGQEKSRPDKSRLKGSGQIEQDADSILLMHPFKDRSMVEVFIDKNRHGPLGQSMLKFDKDTTRFTETEVW